MGAGPLAFKPNDLSTFFQCKGDKEAWKVPEDVRLGGKSRFPETISKAAAYLGLSYGIDIKYVTGKSTPAIPTGKTDNLPALRVTLKHKPILWKQMSGEFKHIVSITRQSCQPTAQATRPHTGGSMRSGFESETSLGGSANEAVRKCKGDIIGHNYLVALRHYLRPTYVFVATMCAPASLRSVYFCVLRQLQREAMYLFAGCSGPR